MVSSEGTHTLYRFIDLLEADSEWAEPEVGDVWVGNGWKKQGTGEIVRDG